MRIEDIQNIVARFCEISVAEMLGMSREERIARPRRIAMYIARKYTSESLPEIACCFRRTHAAVIHAVKMVEKEMETDKGLVEMIDLMQKSAAQTGRPESSLDLSLQELIMIYKGPGEARTIRINGDPDCISIDVINRGAETVVNIRPR